MGAEEGVSSGGWRASNTYKVLSFGMWLKLATESRLMLLLLRVLRGEGKQNSVKVHEAITSGTDRDVRQRHSGE